jgi:hypothetical protein
MGFYKSNLWRRDLSNRRQRPFMEKRRKKSAKLCNRLVSAVDPSKAWSFFTEAQAKASAPNSCVWRQENPPANTEAMRARSFVSATAA